jgi:hypothetical protein
LSRLELLPCPQRIESPTSNRVPYNYHEIRSAFDPQPGWLYDNVRYSLLGTLRRIAILPALQRSGDRYGATVPNIRSLLQSVRWIHRMYEDVRLLGKSWMEPLVSVDEFGDVVFEWWHRSRKVTVYVIPESVEYIKVGGPNIHSDMEDGELRTRQDHQDLWRWLKSGD